MTYPPVIDSKVTIIGDQLGNTLTFDSQGDVRTYLASLNAGEDLTNNVVKVITSPVIGTTYSPSRYVSFSGSVPVLTANLKATAGQLLSLRVTNRNAAARYITLFNSTGSTTGTPLYSEVVPAGTAAAPGSLILEKTFFTENGSAFSTGITFAISTTSGSYVAATAADHDVTIHYV